MDKNLVLSNNTVIFLRHLEIQYFQSFSGKTELFLLGPETQGFPRRARPLRTAQVTAGCCARTTPCLKRKIMLTLQSLLTCNFLPFSWPEHSPYCSVEMRNWGWMTWSNWSKRVIMVMRGLKLSSVYLRSCSGQTRTAEKEFCLHMYSNKQWVFSVDQWIVWRWES